MPVGAYGGKREIMETVSPVGPVYQAGTLSGNPVAMAAGITQLTILKENPQIYQHINHLGVILRDGFQSILEEAGLPFTVNGIGSLNCLFFTKQSVNDYTSAKQQTLLCMPNTFNICYITVFILLLLNLKQCLFPTLTQNKKSILYYPLQTTFFAMRYNPQTGGYHV